MFCLKVKKVAHSICKNEEDTEKTKEHVNISDYKWCINLFRKPLQKRERVLLSNYHSRKLLSKNYPYYRMPNNSKINKKRRE